MRDDPDGPIFVLAILVAMPILAGAALAGELVQRGQALARFLREEASPRRYRA